MKHGHAVADIAKWFLLLAIVLLAVANVPGAQGTRYAPSTLDLPK